MNTRSSSTNWGFDPGAVEPYIGPVLAAERPFQGDQSSAWVLRTGRGGFVLKVLNAGRAEGALWREQRVLAALPPTAGLELPRSVACFERGGLIYGLQTRVEGLNLVYALERGDEAVRHRLVRSWGAALRLIHSWEPTLEFRETPPEALRATAARTRTDAPVELGPFAGWAAGAVLEELEARKARIEPRMVFTHWDYCVPNALVKGGRVSGVVDWVTGRYADYRHDLAAASWSLEYNLRSRAYLPSLLEGYGYEGTLDELRWFEGLWVLP